MRGQLVRKQTKHERRKAFTAWCLKYRSEPATQGKPKLVARVVILERK